MVESAHLRESIIQFLLSWNPEAKDYQDFTVEEVLPDEQKDDRLLVTMSYDRPRKFATENQLTLGLKALKITDRESKVFIIRPSNGEVLGMKRPA